MSNLVLYDEKYNLESHEALFIQMFKETHSLERSLDMLNNTQATRVSASLRAGKSDLALAFKEFVEEAPVHPEANKVVILDNLIWVMNQSRKDGDTNGVVRAVAEINKMIKGNLVAQSEKKVIETRLLGVVDLTKRQEEETIDIESITLNQEENG